MNQEDVYSFVESEAYQELASYLNGHKEQLIEQIAMIDFKKPEGSMEAIKLQGAIEGVDEFFNAVQELKEKVMEGGEVDGL